MRFRIDLCLRKYYQVTHQQVERCFNLEQIVCEQNPTCRVADGAAFLSTTTSKSMSLPPPLMPQKSGAMNL
jgi:hypothetical protein